MSLSEANIYGGPTQTWEAGYMNPVQFFYSTQRNQGISSNILWQIATWWQIHKGLSLTIDLLADDIIVNNENDKDDRGRFPDRLGILIKLSKCDLFTKYSLFSLRYVRIWNETYTTYRNFENYIYFNKGIGYPYNSYEGTKVTYHLLGWEPWIFSFDIEIWQRGSNNLIEPFIDDKNEFPISPAIRGLTYGFMIEMPFYKNIELSCNYFRYHTTSKYSDLLTSYTENTQFDFSISYLISNKF